MYESLTVFETLWYAAQLRLPRNMTMTQKKERVHTVIKALGLDSCSGTIIGALLVLEHVAAAVNCHLDCESSASF